MRYFRVVKKAFYDFGDSDFITIGEIVELLDDTYGNKYLVLHNGYKRLVSRECLKDVYVLLTFDREKISKSFVDSLNVSSIDYWLIPKTYYEYDDSCFNKYKQECLKVLNDDLVRECLNIEKLKLARECLN